MICQAPKCSTATTHGKPHCLKHMLLFTEQAKRAAEADMTAKLDAMAHRKNPLLTEALEITVSIDFGGGASIWALAADIDHFSEINPVEARVEAVKAQVRHSTRLTLTPDETKVLEL